MSFAAAVGRVATRPVPETTANTNKPPPAGYNMSGHAARPPQRRHPRSSHVSSLLRSSTQQHIALDPNHIKLRRRGRRLGCAMVRATAMASPEAFTGAVRPRCKHPAGQVIIGQRFGSTKRFPDRAERRRGRDSNPRGREPLRFQDDSGCLVEDSDVLRLLGCGGVLRDRVCDCRLAFGQRRRSVGAAYVLRGWGYAGRVGRCQFEDKRASAGVPESRCCMGVSLRLRKRCGQARVWLTDLPFFQRSLV